jgi:hypothetical protein
MGDTPAGDHPAIVAVRPEEPHPCPLRADHDWYREWVYNVSDIEGGPVVWAREMSPAQDAEIIKYFAGRKVWLLEADATPPRLTEYPTGRGASGTGSQ